MATSMTTARDNRQSVQIFDVDLFRGKLENYMRKQATEMCEMTNTKKRKLSDRWSDTEKEDLELSEDIRDDLCFQFSKRQRGDSYYPIDDDELEQEEVSPLALPSPVSVLGESPNQPWPFLDSMPNSESPNPYHDANSMPMTMRRQLSGYSEASTLSTTAYMGEDDDNWMSACPPLSRASISTTVSAPDTPQNCDVDVDSEQFMAELYQNNAKSHDHLDLDLSAMEPHERNLLVALAPERFEKAALIKRAFRQSEKLLDQFARENHLVVEQENEKEDTEMQMDDGEYDQVFGELMHV